MPGDPMGEIEMLEAIRNLARITRVFYLQLIEEGFAETQAIDLTGRYVHGLAGGKS